ncbi:MAG: hypothetical protein IJN06_06965 [Bacteroidales bacterium]|nr:hypothetical protein [Bacteroidales bacterium]MBR2478351.1 hypothetical protein [Bacteroidales bacterium]
MQIEIFTMCDNAQDYMGKLVIVGTFNHIHTKALPVMFPGFSIAGRIEYSVGGNKEFKLSIKDPDNVDFLPPQTWVTEVKMENEYVGHANFCLSLNQIVFNKPGMYKAILETEGIAREYKFFVNIAK